MNRRDYIFDEQHLNACKALNRYEQKLTYCDKLEQFLLQHELDIIKKEVEDVIPLLDANINKLFDVCKYIGISEIFIGVRELVTTNVTYDDWPAVWWLTATLAGNFYDKGRKQSVDFGGRSSNSHQSNTNNTALFIPQEYISKAWDVENRESIDIEKFKKNMVSTGRKSRGYHG